MGGRCLRNRPHLEADKVGANGVVYVVCERCGETLTRAPDDRQLSPVAQEQLRRFGGNNPQ